MNIHEYQAKAILKQYGVKVPEGRAVFSLDEVKDAIRELGGSPLVVKAQIHAGGRGKAGGVKLVQSEDEAIKIAGELMGKTLVTAQTGAKGQLVRRLYLEKASSIAKEYYLSLIVDREHSGLTLIASAEGGMDIEEVAIHSPEKITKIHINPLFNISDHHIREILIGLGLAKEKFEELKLFIEGIYKAFITTDASQIEINPLVITNQGELLALDAKINFDENALFRQPEIMKLRDLDEEEQAEALAASLGLNYIKMQGKIGCLVNGAGLAMATMDIIKLHGGEPANFLDVGGGATKEKVTEAFKIILSDPSVRAILVNIFGGIMRCDIIAEGVIAAAQEIKLKVPLVVRLQGTNVEEGKKILKNSGLKIESVDGLKEAAQRVVSLM